jgi:hypothetical protein
MSKVTRNQAIAATILGAGLALTSLLLKRQAARVTAIGAGALLPTAAWFLYRSRGEERHLDTRSGRKWFVQEASAEQFKQLSLESLKALNAANQLPDERLSQLAGHENVEIAKWALKLASFPTMAIETFTKMHSEAVSDAYLGRVINAFLKRNPQLRDKTDLKIFLPSLELNNKDVYFNAVLDGLTEEQKKACVEVMGVTELQDSNTLFDCVGRMSKSGFTPKALSAIKELFTRKGEDDDSWRDISLNVLLNLSKSEVAAEAIEKHKNQHARAIAEIRKYVIQLLPKRPLDFWPLTLLPAETVELIQQFCDQQRMMQLPEGFEPGVTDITQRAFEDLVRYQVLTEEDLIKMVGFKAAELDERGVVDNQVRWAMEELFKRSDVKTLIEAMKVLIEGDQPGACRVATLAFYELIEREDLDWEDRGV